MCAKKRKGKAMIFKIIIVLLIISFFVLCCYTVFEKRLSFLISEMAENRVKAEAAKIMSSVIYEEMEDNQITYDSLVSFEKDAAGRITAMKTNIIEINRLKSKISVKILDDLENMDTAKLQIPIGSIIGGELMAGKGPGIDINVIPVGSVDAEINNEITSAGINQSKHQIMMKIVADLTVITSVTRLSLTVDTHICIAETVIVGYVPGSYTNIDTDGIDMM